MKTICSMNGQGSVFQSLTEVTPIWGFTLDQIGNLCFLNYNININPLQALRKQYPEFEWKLIDTEHGYGDLINQIKDVDFVWSLTANDHVIATHKKRSWKGVRGFWSYDAETHDRTFSDFIQDIEGLGFTVFGTLKDITTTH